MRRAIVKYGPDAFEVTSLESAGSPSDLNEKERYWIQKLGTLVPRGYNMLLGGEQHPLMREAKSKGRRAYLTKRAERGLPKGPSRLSEADVKVIFEAFNAGESQKSLAARFNVHYTTISHILEGKNWAHVGVSLTRQRRKIMTAEEAAELLQRFQQGATVAVLCRDFQRTKGATNKVLRGASFPEVFERITGHPPNGHRPK